MNAPFTANGEYKGDEGEMAIEFNRGASVAINIPGNRIFMGQSVTPTENPSNTE